jgi:hypothetical protein
MLKCPCACCSESETCIIDDAGRPAALKKQRKYMFFGGISPNNVLYSNSTKKNVQNNHQNQRHYTFKLYCNL